MLDQDSGAQAVAAAAVRRGFQALFAHPDSLTQDQVDWLHLDAILRPEVHRAYPRPPCPKPRKTSRRGACHQQHKHTLETPTLDTCMSSKLTYHLPLLTQCSFS